MPPRPDLPELTDPDAVIRWTLDRYGPRVALVTSLGPQSLTILDLVHRAGRTLHVLFLDTGLHFAETLELLDRVEAQYGVSVERIRPALTLDQQAASYGDALWARDADRCCALRKVAPLDLALTRFDAWMSGVRRDQGGHRAHAPTLAWDARHRRVAAYPLALWTRAEVDAYVALHHVPTNPLLQDGYRSIGCSPCTSRVAPDAPERAGRWAGTGKTECGIHHLLALGGAR